MNRKLTAIVVVLLTAVIGVTAALATPALGTVVGTLFARGTLTSPVNADADGITLVTDSTTDHAVQEIVFHPGSSSGWHRHPGVVLVTVTSGTLTHYHPRPSGTRAGIVCDRTTTTAGQSFWESGPTAGVVRNEGDTPVVVYVTFVVPTGAPLRIDMPNPGCPVN